MSALHAVLIQRDGEFDESDTLVTDLVDALRVLLAHPTIDLSLLVDSVRKLWAYRFLLFFFMRCTTPFFLLNLFFNIFSQNYAASIIPDHAQFLAGVLCGDAEKVNTFLARADINVNILSIVRRNSCVLSDCAHRC